MILITFFIMLHVAFKYKFLVYIFDDIMQKTWI